MTRSVTVLIIVLAVSFVQSAWAYTIKGKVAFGNTVIQNIRISISDKEGKELRKAVSDSRGEFVINDINEENVVVEASGEGFADVFLEVASGGTDTDLGVVSMSKIIELNEVSVTTPEKIKRADRTIVYVSKIERERAAGTFNMLTLLAYKAPQLQVKESERTLTVEGEEPVILVNGIQRTMSYISSINPDRIEKIELSNMADPRFGKRSINIVTHRSEDGWWLMCDVTAALTTPRNFLSAVVEYSREKNEFMLYYNGGYRHGRRERVDEEEHYIGFGRDMSLTSVGLPSSTLDKYHDLYFYFNRVPSAKSMLSITAGLSIHDNDRSIKDHVIELTQEYLRTNDRGYSSYRPHISAYYQLNTSEKSSIELEAVGSFSDYSSYRDLSYSTGYDSRLSTRSDHWYFSGEVLWRQSLPFASLNIGLSTSHSNASNRYLIDGISSRNPMSSTSGRAYSSLSGNVLSIGYYLSIGLVYQKVESAQVAPNLNLSLLKKLGNNFTLSYYFRYNPGMPPMSSYNQVVTPVNELMYHVGSDNLKAQRNYSNQVELQFNKNKFFFSLKSALINISRPLMTEYRAQEDLEQPLYGFFLETPSNGRNFRSYGADLNAGVSNLWNFLSMSVSTGWGHNKMKAYDDFTVCSWYLGLNMGLYWKGWQLNLTGSNLVPARSMWGTNEVVRYWPYTSLALYKKIGRWNIHASWSNLFSCYGGRYRTQTLSSVIPSLYDFRMGDQGNLVEIGVRYQFTTGKLIRKKERSVRQSTNSDNGIRWDY